MEREEKEEEQEQERNLQFVECLRRQLLELEMIQSIYFDMEKLVDFEDVQKLQCFLLEYDNMKESEGLHSMDNIFSEERDQETGKESASPIEEIVHCSAMIDTAKKNLPYLTYIVEEPTKSTEPDSFFQLLEMKIILPRYYPSISDEPKRNEEDDEIFSSKGDVKGILNNKTKPQLCFRSAGRERDKALIQKITDKFEEVQELYNGDEYILSFLQEFFGLCDEFEALENEKKSSNDIIISERNSSITNDSDYQNKEDRNQEDDEDEEEEDFDYENITKLIELQKKKKKQTSIENNINGSSDLIQVTLGRRLIHFHHIINAKKRQTLKKTALDLNLGGYCKYGWPGIVIVEGLESDVQEYVQIISSLRWQSITVKYHKTKKLLPISKDDTNSSIDDYIDENRAFHKKFEEVDDMKILARICESVGQKSLFDSFIKSGCVHKEV